MLRHIAAPLVVSLVVVAAACSDDPIPSAPAKTIPKSDAGGAGVGGGGGAGGVDEPPSRGDPSEFPTECLATCAEACGRVDECHGDQSPIFPITKDECELRCALATKGPVWDDVSGNFRCCASQTACSDVQHCGGWLLHPDPVDSCDKLCTCFFSEAATILSSGGEAPEGYRFAPDVVIVEPSAPIDGAEIRGVRSIDAAAGAPAIVHLDRSAGADTLNGLAGLGRVLPTFLDGAGRVVAATGRIVVVAPTEAARSRVSRAAVRLAAVKERGLRAKDAEAVAHVRILELDPWKALGAVSALRAVPGVTAVELDMIRPYERRHVPNDPLFADQWHLRNDGGPKGTASGVDGRVSEAWDVTLGAPEVVVSINDDGVDLDHPDFAGKVLPALGFPDDWKTQMAAGTFAGHGSSCAGVAVANADDNVGAAGVCPGCSLLPHLLGPSTGGQFQISDVDIAQGFQDIVDAGAWVISNSWGPSTGNPVYVEQTFPLPKLPAVVKTAYDYAETTGRGGKGTVILFAAGNANDILDYNGTYTTNLAVAAVGDVGLKSYYSSFGKGMGVAAPSNGGIRGITTTAANGQHTDSFGGTSSACPFAAGVVGLIFSANPDLTAAEARAILKSSATKIDPVWGAYDAVEGSPYYGAGLVNAYVAVELATGACTDPKTCVAPSDDCGATCGTGLPCGACRTDADCAAGSVCQALPSLGGLVCVAAKTAACAPGTKEQNGYCIPTAATCGACPGTETCNGRDEDCDGLVDEEGCSNAPRCFIDAAGCGPGNICAATSCTTKCSTDADCKAPATCEKLKDQYGTVTGAKGCVASQVSQCQLGCEILAASLDDMKLADFVDCMKDGDASCNTAYTCAQKLPVNF